MGSCACEYSRRWDAMGCCVVHWWMECNEWLGCDARETVNEWMTADDGDGVGGATFFTVRRIPSHRTQSNRALTFAQSLVLMKSAKRNKEAEQWPIDRCWRWMTTGWVWFGTQKHLAINAQTPSTNGKWKVNRRTVVQIPTSTGTPNSHRKRAIMLINEYHAFADFSKRI